MFGEQIPFEGRRRGCSGIFQDQLSLVLKVDNVVQNLLCGERGFLLDVDNEALNSLEICGLHEVQDVLLYFKGLRGFFRQGQVQRHHSTTRAIYI